MKRFWAKVDTTGGPDACWPWTASRHPFGYGWVHADGRTTTANRVALLLTSDEEPAGRHALHRCNNPPCCNPRHLYWGTDADNHRDMVRAGRAKPPPRNGIPPPVRRGIHNGRAILDPDKVRAIRTDGRPYSAIARDYGISIPTVCQVRQRRTWREVPG